MISILIAAAVRSAIFAGFAGLVLKAFRVGDARARLAAWTAVLFGVLLMPAVSWWAPQIAIPVRTSIPHSPVAILPLISVAPVPAGAPLPPRTTLDWRTAAAVSYLTIAILLCARLLYGLLLTQRLRRNSAPVGDSRANARLLACATAAGVRTLPQLAESSALAVPITVGWLRPALLLPLSWREWNDAKLDAVFAHELSHIRRGDYATMLLASLNRSLYWFNPVNWWLERHLRDLAEQASDDSALRATGDNAGYAEVLLGFLEVLQDSQGRVRWQGVAMARSGRASRRIERVLSAHSNLTMPVKRSALLPLAALSLPLLYVSAAVVPENESSAAVQRTTPNLLSRAATFGERESHPPSVPQLLAQTPAAPPPPPPPPASLPADSYVIESQHGTTMSGTDEDLRRARSFRYEVGDDYIWFRRGGKAYIIRDPATVKAAQHLFDAQGDLGRRQAALGEAQARLGALQAKLGDAQRGVRTTLPDLTREIERLKEKMRTAGTADQLGDVQSLLGELQAKVADQQAKLSDEQAKLGAEQARLGDQQAQLGAQQAVLGDEQSRRAEEASERLQALLDEALKKGIAQPEPKK